VSARVPTTGEPRAGCPRGQGDPGGYDAAAPARQPRAAASSPTAVRRCPPHDRGHHGAEPGHRTQRLSSAGQMLGRAVHPLLGPARAQPSRHVRHELGELPPGSSSGTATPHPCTASASAPIASSRLSSAAPPVSTVTSSTAAPVHPRNRTIHSALLRATAPAVAPAAPRGPGIGDWGLAHRCQSTAVFAAASCNGRSRRARGDNSSSALTRCSPRGPTYSGSSSHNSWCSL
jgi:hypothetical protein